MYNCDFGVTYKGTSYDFDHVEGLEIDDPEMTKIIRGSNAKNKLGLTYTEGSKEPKKVTCTIIGMSSALATLFTTIYESKERCEFYCVDRTDGSSKIGKSAILSQQPKQLSVNESPDSMNIALIFETFDFKEVHKS